ncbi:hypothetical protein MMYC01_207419 [Madurella mycetomatis]|uniref:Rhodopsin domain-containing protein n=1 Tax=Madurella mycetomatis TaxID=100816 RepID=A0A175VXI4_9PEZI|nr:hypothetical protein MMYC01_207419 [Madurella mycetomatis]
METFPTNSSSETSPFSNGTDSESGRKNETGFPQFWRQGTQLDDLGPTTRVSVWLLAGASFLFIMLRVYCKFVRHRRLHADDHFAIAAWLALLGSAICNNLAIDLGYGKHVWQIPFENVNDLSLIGQISVTLTICSQAWSKTSFAITLLMISDGIHGKTRVFLWFAIVSMNLLFGISAMLFWIGCTPLEKAWHPFTRGTCWSPSVIITYGIFTSAYSGIMDLVLAIIPWKIIMSLQMQTKEKIGVALAMSMGVLSVSEGNYLQHSFLTCLQCRRVSFHQVFLPPGTRKSRLLTRGGRPTACSDDGVTLVIWGSAEAAVTIIAASVPMLGVLVRGFKASRSRSHGRHSRSRTALASSATNSSKRVYYYNKPRRDLVTMTGSTWAGGSR